MKITVSQSSKVLTNGENLILVKVFNNGKYKTYSTSVSCVLDKWNKKTCKVSSKDKNYIAKNKAIENKLKEVQSYYDGDKEQPQREETKIRDFFDVLDAKIENSRYASTKNFLQLKYYLKQHYSSIPLSNLNQNWFDGFIENLKKDKETKQRLKLRKYFNIVHTFALEKGMIKTYQKFEYNKRSLIDGYTNPEERCLESWELSAIISNYKKCVHSNDFFYTLEETDGKKIRRTKRMNDINAVCLFALHLAFQGIAPIDLAQIKVKDLKTLSKSSLNLNMRRYLNDEEYRKDFDNKNKECEIVEVKFGRQKTRESVAIYTFLDNIQPILDILTKDKGENDYLLNCLDASKQYTDKQMQARISNYYVKKVKELNKMMAKYCTMCDTKPIQHTTYYFARHTFITELYRQDVPINIIQRMVGHKTTTLERFYVKPLEAIEQARIIDMFFNSPNEDSVKKLYNEMKNARL